MASRVRRTKPKPNQPDGWDTPEKAPPFEDVLYRILRDSFRRSDAAARAVARLEYQLALQQNADLQEETVTVTVTAEDQQRSDMEQLANQNPPATAAAMIRGTGQVFDDREFVDTFERLSFLKLVLELLRVLGLQELKPELVQALIDDRFRSRAAPGGRVAPETNTIAGSDMAVLVHNLKRMAERRAKAEPKRPRTSVAK